MRVADMVKNLNGKDQENDYKLVLPPWGRIGYHWGYQDSKIPWKKFFNVAAMNKHVPVIEFTEFIQDNQFIDMVWYLQRYKEGWNQEEGFVNKIDDRECLDEGQQAGYQTYSDKTVTGWFYGYGEEMRSKKFKCVSVQGFADILIDKIIKEGHKSVLIDRAENVLHNHFADVSYWGTRRSMQFSKKLFDLAVAFEEENGVYDENIQYIGQKWKKHQPKKGSMGGSNYIAAHVRRKDYVNLINYGRNVPSLKAACDLLLKKAEELKIEKIYIATDGNADEVAELKSHLSDKMMRWEPESPDQARKLRKGGAAIVDQILCSHAKWFIGTEDSTFTFRINEERHILGFGMKTTINKFCKDGVDDCGLHSEWDIEYK